MKERTFPASFWRAPNRPNQNIKNSHNINRGQLLETRTGRIKITSPPDTNLLFSLFKILQVDRTSMSSSDNEKLNKNVLSENCSTTLSSGHHSTTTTDENTNEYSSDDKNDDDNDILDDVLDDPYLSTKQEYNSIGNTIEVSKSYSDILSSLVVNL